MLFTSLTAEREFHDGQDGQDGAPWHETPAVAAYLATIDIDDLYLTRPCVVMGAGELIYTGSPLEDLRDMRRDIIEAQFGCTFREANEQGRANEYLDMDAEHPRVDEVLTDIFGDPRRFGNENEHKATLMMRADVRMKAARVRHEIGRAA